MTEDESRPLLRYLFEHSVRPEFTCRFQWRPGSLALWDNRCAMHNPINDYHGYTRRDAPHHPRRRRAARVTVRSEVTWPTIPAMVRADARDRFGDAEAVVDGTRRVGFASLRGDGRRRGACARRVAASSAATASRCGRRTRSSGSSPRSASRPRAACSCRSTRAFVAPRRRTSSPAAAPGCCSPSRGFLDTDYPALLADAGVELPALEHTVLLAGDARRRRDRLGRLPRARATRCRRRSSTRASRRSVPTTRATSCSRRARPAVRRAS